MVCALPIKFRVAALLVLLGCSCSANAQFNLAERDSLSTLLARTGNAVDRMQPLRRMAWSYLFSKEALPYLAELDSLTAGLVHSSDSLIRTSALHHRSSMFYQRGYQAKFRRRIPEALRDFGQALRCAERAKDTLAVANAMNAQGVSYAALRMPKQAMRWYQVELDLILALAHPPHMYTANIRQHMADALMMMGRFTEAEQVLAKCDTAEADRHALTLMGMAHLAANRSDTAAALALMDRAARVAATSGQPWDRLSVLEPTARFQLRARLPQQALHTAETAIALANDLGDHAAKAGCLVIAGQAALELGHAGEAERRFQEAMAIAEEHGYVGLARETGDDGSMVRAAELLRSLYWQQGRTQEAMRITDLWVAWKDSLHRIEDREAILRFDLEREALTDSIADAARLDEATSDLRAQVTEERQTRQRVLLIGSAGIALSALLLLYLMARRKRERIRAEHALERAGNEQLIRELKQRERISEELHEELGAGLSALKLWSEMDMAEESDPRRQKLLRDRNAMVGELVASLQQIIWAMNSPSGTVKNLVDHMNDAAHLFCAQHNLLLRPHVDPQWPALPLNADQRRLPYLVLKEILMNVVKHSGAQAVELSMHWSMGLHMVVHDDGKGAVERIDGLPGNGLRTMRRRIDSLGGTIRFDGSDGMRVEVHIPLGGER